VSKDKILPEGFVVDDLVAQEIEAQLEEGMLSCARANVIAQKMTISPSLIGHTVDALGIRLYRCQLGLFGYPNKKGWADAGLLDSQISPEFAKVLSEAKSEMDELTCLQLWNLAAEYHIDRLRAGYIAEKLGIRIVACQLGAF
jgi:hypothetical protein